MHYVQRLSSKFIALFIVAQVALGVVAYGQCKNFAKKQCIPALAPYVQTGEFNSAIFSPGESAELQVAFNPGHDYRIMICSEAMIGEITLKVYDASNKLLYTSKNSSENKWDFNVASAQTLTIQVEVGKNTNPNKIVPQGCVTILMGMKR